MPARRTGDNRAKAEALVDAAEAWARADGRRPVTPAGRSTLTDALTKDFDEADRQARVDDRERLATLETLTRAIADAVLAIADAVAPAVKAAKSGPITPVHAVDAVL